jgi:hypothetical protein
MRKTFCVVAVLALLAIPVFAQDNPKADVFGGYQYTRINPGHGITGENFNGWNAAVTGWANGWLGVTGDFSGAYKTVSGTKVRQYTFMFGPTIASHSNDKFVPFAHVLLGGAHCSTDAGPCFTGSGNNAFALAFGGGLDLGSKKVAVRVGQFDYLMTRFASDHQNDFRYSAGVVFRF